MSIINDALKKTQNKLNDKPNKNENSKNSTIKLNSQENNQKNKTAPFLFFIILPTLGIIFWLTIEIKPHIIGLMEQYKTSTNTPQATPKSEPMTVVKKIKKTPKPKESSKISKLNGLKLNGIINSEDGNAVLINNNVYEEGDDIEGYIIKKILLKKIILEKDGVTAELETRN